MWKKSKVYLSVCLAVAMLVPQAWIAPAAKAAAVGDTVITGNFDTGVDGWFKRGSETVVHSTDTAQSGAGSLKTTGRTANWHGPGTYVDSLEKGATYEFSIYAKLLEGTPGGAAIKLAVSQEGLSGDDPDRYKNINSQQVSAVDWVEIKGNFTLDPRATRYQVYVESDSATASYYIDTFQVKLVSAPPEPEVKVPVVVYHVITPNPSGDYQYSLESFKAHMKYLADNGYTTLSAATYRDIILNGAAPPEKPILLTFDDGTPDFYTNAYPVLKQYGMKATQFIVNDWINDYGMSAAQLQELSSDPNIDLQNHTQTHPDLKELTKEAAAAEIAASNQYLKSITGQDPYMLAYPYGGYNAEVEAAAQENGILLAFKVGSGITRPTDNKYALGREIILVNDTLSTFAAKIGGPTPPPETPTGTVVLNQSFEDDAIGGWERLSWGGAGTAAISSEQASDGTKSLKFSGRSAVNSALSLDVTNLMKSDRKYDVSFKLRLGAGADNIHLASKMISGGAEDFPWVIGNKEVTSTAWTAFETKGYEIPSNTTEFRVYIEATNSLADVYLDEFKIVDVTPEGTGEEPGDLDQSGLTADFEDGQGEWVRRFGEGMIEVTSVANYTASGSKSLLTTASAQYDGPLLNVLGKMHRNHEYSLSAWVKMAPGQQPTRLRLSVQSGESTFTNVSANATVTDDEWVQLSGKFTLRTTPAVLNAYVETADDNGGPRSFYMDDFALTYVGPVEGPLPVQTDLDSLKDLYSDYFEIGAAVEPAQFTGTADQLLKKHYNSIVAENSMKPASINPNENTFNYTGADTIVNYAKDNNMTLRFHTLLWHQQGSDWMLKDAQGNWLEANETNKELVLNRLRAYIATVVTKYADVADDYDVVNEVIDEGRPDGMRDSHWYRITGTDFIKVAFEAARAADPTAKLYINDYSTHNPQKRDFLFNLVTKLKAEGVPIDGVGHQTHINISGPSIQQISDSIRKFGEAGFDNQITELDISVYTNNSTAYDPIPEDILIRQGYRYKELFEELVKLDNMGKNADPSSPAFNPDGWISNVTIWGIADDHSWLHNRGTTRQDAPFPFDKRHQAKYAYWGMVEAVKNLVPSKLPIVTKAGNAAQGTPVVDGQTDAIWNTVSAMETERTAAFGASFKTLWDDNHLYVLAHVQDSVKTAEDKIEFFINEGGTITVIEIPRSAVNHVVETTGGYVAEYDIPLSANTLGKQVSFDLRITTGGAQDGTEHGQNGAIFSWSDPRNLQHQDTAGYGKLTLVAAPKSAQAVKGTPVIDGDADAVWANANELETTVWVEGTSGSTAKFKTMWDEQNLYVYAVVTDALLSDASENAWEEDSVEIFVDQNNGKTTAYQADDGQYRINFNNVKTVGGHASQDSYTSATKVVDGVGYVVEAAIRLDTISPKDGTVIGFDLQVNNDQDGSGTRDSVVNWADPSGQSYQNTSRFGVLQFTAPSAPPGSPSPVTPPSDDLITVTPGVTNGRVLGTINNEKLRNALANASANANGVKEVVVELSAAPGAQGYEVALPAEALNSNDKFVITVKTDIGTVQIPSNMLTDLDVSETVMISIVFGAANLDNADEAVRSQIGSRPAIDLQVHVDNQAIIWNNQKAPVTISIPYQPTAEELRAPGKIVIWYVDDNGNATAVPNGRYDTATGSVVFRATHFSTYAVVHVDKSFDDIGQYVWATAAIEAMASRDVIQGASETKFKPSDNIKRADFLLLLVRALGLQSEGGTAFDDVNATDYYYDAVRIAKELGIAKGEGNGRFSPQAQITRQEMMVLTVRALEAAGQQLEFSGSMNDFSDASAIADYAKDSASALVASGIVNGIDGEIRPDGLLTRAQAAVILYRAMGLE
ncbi:endo-1,4-beta-xylanase [Paenibacillus sp. sgz302251]|uniref:endo-1,4-beta-xylanase n=1 Tax=Paenibacillus sp. sgz302251 TaxID=3414493 RepID=UPI003C7BC448